MGGAAVRCGFLCPTLKERNQVTHGWDSEARRDVGSIRPTTRMRMYGTANTVDSPNLCALFMKPLRIVAQLKYDM